MGLPFNRGELGQALAQFFGFKGQLAPELETGITPVANIGDVWDTPYLRYAIPVGEQASRGGVALNYGHILCTPGRNVALQITQIRIKNSSATTNNYQLALLTAANIATLLAAANGVQMIDLSAPQAITRRSSRVESWIMTALVGTGFDFVRLAADAMVQIDLPRPGIILYGNDPGGVPGLAVQNTTIATDANATFYGREWPLPG